MVNATIGLPASEIGGGLCCTAMVVLVLVVVVIEMKIMFFLTLRSVIEMKITKINL